MAVLLSDSALAIAAFMALEVVVAIFTRAAFHERVHFCAGPRATLQNEVLGLAGAAALRACCALVSCNATLGGATSYFVAVCDVLPVSR